MTLRQLATFLAVAESGSVKGAAARLFVTQPAVSAVIGALQRELGVELLSHASRGVHVTPAGSVLASYARQILGLLDEAATATSGAADLGRGRVRLGAVTTAGENLMPTAIASFRAARPTAEVSLEVGNSGHVWERLEAHEVDVVIGGRPPGHRRLRVLALRPHELVIVAAPGITRGVMRAPDLAKHTWLLREAGSGTRAAGEEYLRSHGAAPSTLTLGSNGAVREATAVGLGITLISHDAVEAELANGRLVVVRAPRMPLRRHWHLVTRDDGRLPGPARLFVDHLIESSEFVATDTSL
jgi:LysR family transcriptional regulator, low CO2-responsive transcriptional regulator